jgi:hypothetical protein
MWRLVQLVGVMTTSTRLLALVLVVLAWVPVMLLEVVVAEGVRLVVQVLLLGLTVVGVAVTWLVVSAAAGVGGMSEPPSSSLSSLSLSCQSGTWLFTRCGLTTLMPFSSASLSCMLLQPK